MGTEDLAPPRVVIVGAGFGGLNCARALAGAPVEVILLDRNNYHLFTPLLYQVASSLLNPSDIAYPVRTTFRKTRNIRVRKAEVTAVDRERMVVVLGDGEEVAYDRLVLALGSTTNHFGMEELERHALGLKDLPEAMELRNHVLSVFEEASRTGDPARRAALMTFVVVGGGPTGVEYSGALSELVRLVLVKDFPELDLGQVRIILVELMDGILPMFRPDLSEYALEELRRRGVEVTLEKRVTGCDGERILLSDGSEIEAATLVWGAGVKAPAIVGTLGETSRSGRIEVDEALRIRGSTCVYAIGDMAAFVQEGHELPMIAPPAMQQGRHVARNVLRDLAGKSPLPFRYRDKGIMATIGRNAGVTQSGALSLTGFAGWVAWLFLHLFYLIGFRNRFVVLFHWAWEYLRYDRPVRLIARARGPEDRE
jgi:NADH dehydrogenase